MVVTDTTRRTLQGFVEERTEADAQVYTDESSSYVGIDRPHNAVRHSAGECSSRNRQAHTNGIESHWALLKRGIVGTGSLGHTITLASSIWTGTPLNSRAGTTLGQPTRSTRFRE